MLPSRPLLCLLQKASDQKSLRVPEFLCVTENLAFGSQEGPTGVIVLSLQAWLLCSVPGMRSPGLEPVVASMFLPGGILLTTCRCVPAPASWLLVLVEAQCCPSPRLGEAGPDQASVRPDLWIVPPLHYLRPEAGHGPLSS